MEQQLQSGRVEPVTEEEKRKELEKLLCWYEFYKGYNGNKADAIMKQLISLREKWDIYFPLYG